MLLRQEHWTSGDLARHPEPREIARSMRKLGNLNGEGRLVRTFEMRRSVTEDVAENRFVRHVTEDVQRRLAALPEEPEAVLLLRELNAAAHLAPFLIDAGPMGRPPVQPTAVLREDPLYRCVYEIWGALHRDA